MSKSCKGMLENMLKCVEGSDCVQEQNHTLKKCMKDGQLFPEECTTLRQLYLQCKRGQLDMRSRLRGNKGY
jgi:cytochrome c oxidase assembly factor 5